MHARCWKGVFVTVSNNTFSVKRHQVVSPHLVTLNLLSVIPCYDPNTWTRAPGANPMNAAFTATYSCTEGNSAKQYVDIVLSVAVVTHECQIGSWWGLPVESLCVRPYDLVGIISSIEKPDAIPLQKLRYETKLLCNVLVKSHVVVCM
jgi:hypothetical protein